jgi:phytol kinase
LGRKNKLFYNRNKSLAGSSAMLLGSFLLSEFFLLLFTHFGYLDCFNPATAAKVFLVCGLTTIVESLPINQYIDDNISVPLFALALGSLLL